MTRERFDKTFLELYDSLVRWAGHKFGPDGVDIVHTTYTNALVRQTYLQGPRQHAARWVRFKLARELARYRKAKRLRDQKTWGGRDSITSPLYEREQHERPDQGLELQAALRERESCT